MADYIVLEKEAIEKLSFLNGEVGKVQKKLQTFQEELTALELSKETKEKELYAVTEALAIKTEVQETSIAAKNEELVQLSGNILSATQELNKLKESIEANKGVVSKTLAEFSLREKEIERNEERLRKGKADVELEVAQSVISRNEITNMREAIKLAQDRLDVQVEKHQKDVTSLESQVKKVEDGKEENFNVFKANTLKAGELEKESERLSAVRRTLDLEKTDLESRESKVKDLSKELADKQDALKVIEKSIEERERLSANREQKSLIKEEEVRIREKKVALKEQVE